MTSSTHGVDDGGERSTRAGELLGELSARLAQLTELVQATAGMIQPTSVSTLPGVTETLSSVARATESAALLILHQAEAIQEDERRLAAALSLLREHLDPADLDACSLWAEAASCSTALGARALKIIGATSFQDLTAQHLDQTLQAIDDVRSRLGSAAALLELPAMGVETPGAVITGVDRPRRTSRARQALADQLLAERR